MSQASSIQVVCNNRPFVPHFKFRPLLAEGWTFLFSWVVGGSRETKADWHSPVDRSVLLIPEHHPPNGVD